MPVSGDVFVVFWLNIDKCLINVYLVLSQNKIHLCKTQMWQPISLIYCKSSLV